MAGNRIILLLAALLLAGGCASSGSGSDDGAGEEQEGNFLQRSWYAEQGVQLPRQFGVGLNVIAMNRDIEVTDVRVSAGDLPPQSISDRADFEVTNRTLLTMARLDAWVLPFLDLYAILGRTKTSTSLSTSFEIDPPLRPPVPVEIQTNQEVEGPVYGGGATLVFGVGDFFGMVDANYTRTDLDAFEGTLDIWFLSGRVGWQHTADRLQTMIWVGGAWLDSKRTLEVLLDLPVLGETRVEVDQQPVNPATLQLGGSVMLDRRWHLMLEVGTNFDDASLLIGSLAFRF